MDARHRLGWEGTWLLWTALFALHFSQREQIQIIVATTYFGGKHRGYYDASDYVFQRPLPQLSAPELATLVAIGQSPSRYRSNPALLFRSRDRLLAQLPSGN